MFGIFICAMILTQQCFALSQCKTNVYRSTEEWKNLFIGKCLLYKLEYDPGLFCNRDINCTALWQMTLKVVEFQPKCNFTKTVYEPLLQSTEHYVPKDKFIFWTGVYSLIGRYTNKGKKLYNIADTLAGYLFDNVAWCGNATESDGIEKYTSSCPGFEINENCQNSAQSEFWAAASQHFARHAYGEIHLMVNATRSPAFRANSYFTQHELPNLNASKVSKATILMVHYFNEPALENCESASIEDLKSRFLKKGITPICIENPRDVELLLCADNPKQPECQALFLISDSIQFGVNISLLIFVILVCRYIL